MSNLTAASGLVAVVLGSSDVLKAVLGAKAEAAIAVATVAGAIALALIGAAGVLVLALRKPTAKDVSIVGLCAGTAVALGAAGGQVWTITTLTTSLSVGYWAEISVWAGCVAASVLLVGYAWTSVYGLLAQGTAPVLVPDPLASPAPADVVAAAIVAAALLDKDAVDHEHVTKLLGSLAPPAAQAKPPHRVAEHSAARRWAFPLQERSALP